MSPDQIRQEWDTQGCTSEVQMCDGTRVIISQYLNKEFWTYFLDAEDGTYDQLIFSYIGDPYEILEGFGGLNRFNDNAFIGRLYVDENGFLNLTAKLLIAETELTENILSTYVTAWLMDFENMVHLIEQGKGN